MIAVTAAAVAAVENASPRGEELRPNSSSVAVSDLVPSARMIGVDVVVAAAAAAVVGVVEEFPRHVGCARAPTRAHLCQRLAVRPTMKAR